MDISNSSWSIFASTLASAASAKVPPLPPLYLVPFVVWTHEPAGVVRAKEEEKAPITESCDRRAMTTWNSDGHAYSLDEFTEYFGKSAGLEQWRKAVPVVKMERPLPPQPGVKPPEVDTDDEAFMRITKTLMNLLEDDAEEIGLPFRHRLRNAKLSRSAVIWTRVVKKLLLLLRNDRTRRSAVGA